MHNMVNEITLTPNSIRPISRRQDFSRLRDAITAMLKLLDPEENLSQSASIPFARGSRRPSRVMALTSKG
jgi:hypothetical protein